MSSTDQLGTNGPPIRIDSSMVSTMAGQLTANTAQPATHPLMSHIIHNQTINQTMHPALHHTQRHPHMIPAPSPHRPIINQSVIQPAAVIHPVTPSNNQQPHHQASNPSPTPSSNQSNAQHSHQHDDHDDHDDSDVDDSDDDGSDAPNSASMSHSNKGGSSCHQCKSRRNYTALTYCTATLDAKSKKCRKKFCGHCLRKFYKENPSLIASKSSWICPSCRKICCCAACRRRKQRESGSAGPDEEQMKKRSKLSNSYQSTNPDQSTYNAPYEPNTAPSHDQSTSQAVNPSQTHTPPDADTGAMSDEDDDSLGHVPQLVSTDVFNTVLASHISLLAEETVQDHGETQFSVLYKAARSGKVRKRIREILKQTDLTSQQKVELISRALVNIV